MPEPAEFTILRQANEACQEGRLAEIGPLLIKWSETVPPEPDVFGNIEELIQRQLEAAAESEFAHLAGYLLDHGATITSRIISAAHPCEATKIFQCFLDHGWDINSAPRMTSLQYDATTDVFDIVLRLTVLYPRRR